MNSDRNRDRQPHLASTYYQTAQGAPIIPMEREEGNTSHYENRGANASMADSSRVTSVPPYTSRTLAFNAIEKRRFTWQDITACLSFVFLHPFHLFL